MKTGFIWTIMGMIFLGVLLLSLKADIRVSEPEESIEIRVVKESASPQLPGLIFF